MKLKALFILIIILFLPFKLNAAEVENYFLQTSFYTFHYSQKDYQNNHQQLIGLERHYTDKSLNGIAFFENTYAQNTIYVYKGKNYEFFKMGGWQITGKFTYGIVHGYDDEDGKYNTWMHDMETFPGIVFGVGFRKKPFRVDILPFADAGIIITGGVEF